MTKIKLYKNPERDNVKPYKPYVPAYQVHGLSPSEIAPAAVATQTQLTNHAPIVSRNNPRARPTEIFTKNMPFADVPTQPSPVGKGPLPNIGNNVETNWFSVDGEDFDDVIIDEESSSPHKAILDPNHPMIDNNHDDINNYLHIPEKLAAPPAPHANYMVENGENNSEQLNVGDNDYVLILKGDILIIDGFDVVQEQVRALVFGEHELNKTNDISPDDIIVLKRVKIKIGVFLE